MKPLSIADYLNDIGRAATEEAPPRRESSPFRPRSLPSVHSDEPVPRAAFNALASAGGGGDTQGKEGPRRTSWERKRIPPAVPAGSVSAASEAFNPEDIAGRLAEAYARGREEGLVEGRADASDRHAAELAAMRREAETDRLELQRNECAELESAIRTGLKQIEDNVGAAVTRLLAPFVSKQVVKQAADELCNAIARLGAAGLPGSMTDSRPTASARELARTDRRFADRGRLCRRRGRRDHRRGRRHANRDRASLLGGVARPARRLSGAYGRATSGNRHRQAPQLA